MTAQPNPPEARLTTGPVSHPTPSVAFVRRSVLPSPHPPGTPEYRAWYGDATCDECGTSHNYPTGNPSHCSDCGASLEATR